MDLITILDAIQTLSILVLGTIGITGGIKTLVPRLPAIGPIPGGLWLSWVVALVWVIASVVVTGGPCGALEPGVVCEADIPAYLAAQWALVAATANVVRNWINPPLPA